jgi:hypothetical protein
MRRARPLLLEAGVAVTTRGLLGVGIEVAQEPFTASTGGLKGRLTYTICSSAGLETCDEPDEDVTSKLHTFLLHIRRPSAPVFRKTTGSSCVRF